MKVSDQIIKVLDAICEKIGIVIDWTKDNILPQLYDVLSRYAKYRIVKESVAIVLDVAIIISIVLIFKNIFRSRSKRDSVWWEDFLGSRDLSTSGHLVLIFSGIIAVGAIICAVFNIYSLLEWVIVPEVSIIKEIRSLM